MDRTYSCSQALIESAVVATAEAVGKIAALPKDGHNMLAARALFMKCFSNRNASQMRDFFRAMRLLGFDIPVEDPHEQETREDIAPMFMCGTLVHEPKFVALVLNTKGGYVRFGPTTGCYDPDVIKARNNTAGENGTSILEIAPMSEKDIRAFLTGRKFVDSSCGSTTSILESARLLVLHKDKEKHPPVKKPMPSNEDEEEDADEE